MSAYSSTSRPKGPKQISATTANLPDTTEEPHPSDDHSAASATTAQQLRPRRHSAPNHSGPIRYEYDVVLPRENLVDSAYRQYLESSEPGDDDSDDSSSDDTASSESEVEILGTLPSTRFTNGAPSSSRPLRPPLGDPVPSSSSFSLPSTSPIPPHTNPYQDPYYVSFLHPNVFTSRSDTDVQQYPPDSNSYAYQPTYPSIANEAPQVQYPSQQLPVEMTSQQMGMPWTTTYYTSYEEAEHGAYLNPNWCFPPPGLVPSHDTQQQRPQQPQQRPQPHPRHEVIASSHSRHPSPLPNSSATASSQGPVPFPILSEPSRSAASTSSPTTNSAQNSGLAPNVINFESALAQKPSPVEHRPQDPSIKGKAKDAVASASTAATSSAQGGSGFRQQNRAILIKPIVSVRAEPRDQGKLQVLAARARDRRKTKGKGTDDRLLDPRREERRLKEEEDRRRRKLEDERKRKEIEAEHERVRKEQREETKHLRDWELRLQKEEVRLWKEAARLREEEERMVAEAEERARKEQKAKKEQTDEKERLRNIEAIEAQHHQKERMQQEESRLQKEEARLRIDAEQWFRTKAEEREALRVQKTRLRAEEDRLLKDEERLRKEKERLLYEEDRIKFEEDRIGKEKESMRKEVERLQQLLGEQARKEEEERARRKAEKKEAQRQREEEERKRKEAERLEARRQAEHVKKEEEVRREWERLEKAAADKAEARLFKPREPCERAGGQPCTACKHLDVLEPQLRKLLADYEEGLAAIKKSHITLVLRVPSEVLTTIFMHCISASSEVEYMESKDALYVPLRLAAACTEWRKVAFASPQLWTTLVVDLKAAEGKHVSVISEWISRSDKLLLRVHAKGPPTISKEGAKKVYPIIDALNKVSVRWEKLIVCLPSLLLSRLQGNSAPALAALTIRTPVGLEQNFKGQLTFKVPKPGPSRVWIENVRFSAVGIQWDGVKNVSISGLCVDECLQLFKHATNVTRCIFKDVMAAGGHFSLPSKPISNATVANLEFTTQRDIATCNLFFSNVILPALTELEISARSVPNEALVSFVRRSKCSLTSLTVTNCAINDDNLLPVLRAMPTLTEFYLEPAKLTEYNPAPLFELLGKTALPGSAAGKDPLLPKLETFMYISPVEKFDWHLVPTMFGPLANMKEAGRRPLNSVIIQFYLDEPITPPRFVPADVKAIMALREAGVKFDFRDECDGTDLFEEVLKMECIVCASRDSANLYQLHRPCSVKCGQPCDSCQEMIDLRAQIEVAQEVVSQAVQTLGKLLDQQREIAFRMNRAHDRTILRFPPEISSAIFQFAAPPLVGDTIVFNLPGYDYQFRRIMSATLSLAAVCREWRQLVCSTPQLWTSLRVQLQPTCTSYPYLDYVRSWINRSGALPLTIYIYTKWQDNRLEYLCQCAEYLISLLNSCSGRWQSLTLRLPYSILRRLSGNSDSGSILRSLKLISANHGTNEGVRFGIAGARPAHVYLSAISSRVVSLNWGNTTQVELDDLRVDDILELLRNAPRLLICTVSNVDDPAVPTSLDITAHQSLRELNVVSPVLDDVGSFFNHVNLPCLEKLLLDMDDGLIPYSSLLTMLSRSSPPLKDLQLFEEHKARRLFF
ncbi:hypothetical protein CVT26_011963 [Gymnopilus dilepis]|uniref:F-box domain-containing protein n=1 Tax=Gymnopilus dilepis TaxID=231916 RepID=A0A409YHY0_9AGAR|nr:hypothetical protein CVT26_011963 [Gymnopilus dilepis]